jgi:adenine-specific DNA-methyltransferase
MRFMTKEKSIKNDSVLIKVDHRKIKQINEPTEQYSINLDAIFKKENAFNIYLKQDTELLVNKIRQNTLPLENIAYVTVGINTGYIKDKLVADSKVDDSYHKVVNGKDIAPFAINWGGEWIKYDKEYVDSFGELGRSLPAEYIFNTPKILVQRTRRGLSRKLICAFDDGVYYNLNRLSNIVVTNNKFHIFYILALLNSKLLDYYFNVVFNEYEVKPLHLSQLPIKNVDQAVQNKFVEIVREILAIRLGDSSADISQQEELINQLVYDLYDITNEEVAVIESL